MTGNKNPDHQNGEDESSNQWLRMKDK